MFHWSKRYVNGERINLQIVDYITLNKNEIFDSIMSCQPQRYWLRQHFKCSYYGKYSTLSPLGVLKKL